MFVTLLFAIVCSAFKLIVIILNIFPFDDNKQWTNAAREVKLCVEVGHYGYLNIQIIWYVKNYKHDPGAKLWIINLYILIAIPYGLKHLN